MAALNVSGLKVHPVVNKKMANRPSDLVGGASPLISYSPAGAWTDSVSNDTSAQVRLLTNILAFPR